MWADRHASSIFATKDCNQVGSGHGNGQRIMIHCLARLLSTTFPRVSCRVETSGVVESTHLRAIRETTTTLEEKHGFRVRLGNDGTAEWLSVLFGHGEVERVGLTTALLSVRFSMLFLTALLTPVSISSTSALTMT